MTHTKLKYNSQADDFEIASHTLKHYLNVPFNAPPKASSSKNGLYIIDMFAKGVDKNSEQCRIVQ